MKRLTLNQDSEIKVKDIYGKMHDYENTGYTIDFIDNFK